MPINYLILQALKKFGAFYGDQLNVEYPVGSGITMSLSEAVVKLTERVVSLFVPDALGDRKLHAEYNYFYNRPGNEHLLLFYEYFNGDSGRGLGASHQTGWTALVALLMHENYERQPIRDVVSLEYNEE
jgi:hypothetical protein